jgi:hypothetical protein
MLKYQKDFPYHLIYSHQNFILCIVKNINSEPKKRSLQIFKGLHKRLAGMEQQNEVPDEESS